MGQSRITIVGQSVRWSWQRIPFLDHGQPVVFLETGFFLLLDFPNEEAMSVKCHGHKVEKYICPCNRPCRRIGL
jgi:hypothetical protein